MFDNITIQLWIKASGERDAHYIMGQTGWISGDIHFDITDDQNGERINFNINSGLGNPSSDGVDIHSNWANIAVTYGNGIITYYYNGDLWGTSSNNGINVNLNGLRLGNHFNDTRWLFGSIKRFTIWNEVLTEDQLQFNITSEQLYSGDLVADWRFGLESGDVLYDHSGNGKHGTIVGPSWEEVIPGCMDVLADNYNENANLDDEVAVLDILKMVYTLLVLMEQMTLSKFQIVLRSICTINFHMGFHLNLLAILMVVI